MGVIEISGKAEKFVNYDIAVISIAFFEDAKTSSSASKAVMKECEKFLEKLDKEGINIKDITLDNDSVSKEKYSDKQQVNASREVALRIPFNMEVINRIRQIADENEYSIEYDIDYELSNESQIREELLKEALLDSKKKPRVGPLFICPPPQLPLSLSLVSALAAACPSLPPRSLWASLGSR